MPAGFPGDSFADNFGNPNEGNFVIFDALSGPKGSPFDNDGSPPDNCSTGGLSTGIGFGSPPVLAGPAVPFVTGGSVAGFDGGDFTDDYTLGVTKPDGTASADSTLVYIGGGKSVTSGAPLYYNPAGQAGAVPYTAGFGICGGGNGGSRDSGANTGFGVKSVTAVGAVANGAAVEAGWINRSGVALVATQAVFGSATVANVAPA